MIWIARNGYVGAASVAALVEADDEEDARTRAIEAFVRNGCQPDAQKVTEISPIALPVVCEIDL